MARFALLLPREEMVEPAGRIARELEMDVVLNQSVPTERILDLMEDCRRAGADILVARGRQASILKEHTDFPVVEIQLTGLEIARLLHRARSLVSHLERPKIGVVTIPNMVGNIQGFEEIFDIELHTYFISGLSEMERGAEQAVADGMDVILGGDFVNAYCRRLGKRTLFFDGTEDSLRTSLLHARNVGQVADAERRNTAHLQVLLDYSFNGILELDARGIIVQSNDVACKILEQEREKLVGLPLSHADAPGGRRVLGRRAGPAAGALLLRAQRGGVCVVAICAPVADWDAGEGLVFSFYEMKMERQEAGSRRNLPRRAIWLTAGLKREPPAGRCPRLVKLARTFAETGQPILVYGEVGGGKSSLPRASTTPAPCSKGLHVTFDCAAHSPEQGSRPVPGGQGGGHRNRSIWTTWTSSPGGRQRCSAVCSARRELHVQGEDTPTPVAARGHQFLTGTGWLEAGVFQPELYYLLHPLRLSLPPPAHPPGRSEPGHRHVPGRLRGEVQPLCGALGRPGGCSWTTLAGQLHQLRAFLERMVLTAPARTVNDGYVRSWRSSIPSRWSAPGAGPPPPSPPRPPGWRRCLPASSGSRPRPPPRKRHRQNHPLAADEAVWHPTDSRADPTADRVRPGDTWGAPCLCCFAMQKHSKMAILPLSAARP